VSQAVLIVGGTARAAAGSARRAGWCVRAIDPFGDRDLRQIAEYRPCPFESFPQALPEQVGGFPPGPFLYTGGLENHPDVLSKLMRSRPLVGNPPEVLAKVRDPFWLQRTLALHGHAFPRTLPGSSPLNAGHRWLRKSLTSAGGLGVRMADASDCDTEGYLQELVEGSPCSAVYFSDAEGVTFLGCTEQLIGQDWLHTSGYQYCGTIGPMSFPPAVVARCQDLGCVLHEASGLRGLWGVDFLLQPSEVIAIEVNPRYTASIEVLELAQRRSAFGEPSDFSTPSQSRTIGKAIYFAPHALRFPYSGAWDDDLSREWEPWIIPGHADIPAAGERIEAGRPVLTFFAEARTREECEAKLRDRARELDRLMETP